MNKKTRRFILKIIDIYWIVNPRASGRLPARRMVGADYSDSGVW